MLKPSATRVAVIDYGICNVRSVVKAFQKISSAVDIVSRPENLGNFTHWVLPGVGSFPKGMANLRSRGFDKSLRQAADAGVPLLGICLGMQLLAERGTEGYACPGLGLLPGTVLKLSLSEGLRVPHMGWNDCQIKRVGSVVDIGSLAPIFYFLHSYHLVLKDPTFVTAWCSYGEGFIAAVQKGNVAGCQFHPEKSQRSGLAVLENFLRLPPVSLSFVGRGNA